MATLAQTSADGSRRPDLLSGMPRAHAIDRWIFVFMAAWFIVIVLIGFIPDSLNKIAAVQAGERPPFPLVLHMHAVLMGSFLLLLLAQTWLMATGRRELHMRLGVLGAILAIALVVVGFVLIPTMYHQTWNLLQSAPPEAREKLQTALLRSDNGKLQQLRIGLLFPLFFVIALRARRTEPGLHKRMMILATAMPLPAGIDRIVWLPKTLPVSPLSSELYMLVAVLPMFLWDVYRNRRVHNAYWIWLAINVPIAVGVHGLWDRPWWHAVVPRMMGVESF